MANLSIPIERRDLTERRGMKDRRVFNERKIPVEKSTGEQLNHRKKFPLLFELTCLALAGITGLLVYITTGLHDGISSTIVQTAVGCALAFWFMIMFKSGLYIK